MFTISLKKSFLKGFTSPASLFVPFSSDVSPDDFYQPARVEDAWNQVGWAFAQAFSAQKDEIDAQKNTAQANEKISGFARDTR